MPRTNADKRTNTHARTHREFHLRRKIKSSRTPSCRCLNEISIDTVDAEKKFEITVRGYVEKLAISLIAPPLPPFCKEKNKNP